MMKKLYSCAAAVGVASLFLTGCGEQSGSGKTAELAYVNWAEGVAYTHLAQAVLEEKMGYDVKLTSADVGACYIDVAQGNQDAFMECWRGLHTNYLDRCGDDVVSLGVVYEGTETGLAVPSYVTIDKISELEANADKFGGHITGIDAGAGMMTTVEEELMPAYGLNEIRLMPSSGPAMTAALADAIKNKEWIVVTAWKPHWMFGRWDIKFLQQDDDKIMWKKGDIEIIGRSDLDADKPELAQFLKNMYLTDAELSDLMVKVNDSDADVSDVAMQWMHDNEDVVADWVTQP